MRKTKRTYLLPPGCKNITDAPHKSSKRQMFRVNRKIRADKIELCDIDGNVLGVFTLEEALNEARRKSLDIVEFKRKSKPPLYLLVDFGMFKFRFDKGLLPKTKGS
jgi:translation initiation factor IF-3